MTKREKSWVVYGDFDSDGEVGGRTIHEDEDAFMPKPTGILDRQGRMICREPERIGFRLR